ncbi:hypothetical protein BCR33DRAFT_719638 [Rhizoclosmatium globosum]|uniref:Uncharacterized protein n=1 Tax=Rhizoclosmatium globosum TaxID=329046 RepID=A0A1Y2BYH1_9FUNG|nr:hypothetical protein BCR33DRAFT_719638 [Rhizoclosmatium globosum]|eukprot:ORY39810.1 hypothetical protein BCR33DRAFT_719638 [Rhizoclosmatium globosum]
MPVPHALASDLIASTSKAAQSSKESDAEKLIEKKEGPAKKAVVITPPTFNIPAYHMGKHM